MKRRTLLAFAASTVLLAACNQSPTTDTDTNATDSAAASGSDSVSYTHLRAHET